MSLYIPKNPAGTEDSAALIQYLSGELGAISDAFNLLQEGRQVVRSVAPKRPRQGQVVYADGVTWNPGYGEGEYTYNGTDWIPLISGTRGFRNKLLNGNFRVNQVGYATGAVLAAGKYGHDGWKAGASGGDYTFTQLKNSTQITILSGKSLIQVLEDANIEGGSYVLSWKGSVQARYAINSATPSGSFAASPIRITGQTAGTTMSVEFNAGTLSEVQLETGATPTAFEQRPISAEFLMAMRYYETSYPTGTVVPTNNTPFGWAFGPAGGAVANLASYAFLVYKVQKCALPNVTTYSYTNSTVGVASTAAGTDLTALSAEPVAIGTSGFVGRNHSGANITPANGGFIFHWESDARL